MPTATAADNLLLNPGAEQGKGGSPSIWERASVPADGLKMERTTSVAKEGKASLMISNEHKYAEPTANNWMQQLQTVPKGATLRVSAAIRTKDADSANVCLQCWDATGDKMLAFGSTPVVRGDQDWIRLTSGPVIVPAATASIIIRAALMGTGTAWFDDFVVASEQESEKDQTAGGAENSSKDENAPSGGTAKESETDLSKIVAGKLVQRVPVSKDCMVLAYLKDWKYGNVDNIGVANNDGGVRTLLAWKPLPAKAVEGANRRVYLALYSRETKSRPNASEITITPINQKWPEITSWETQPKIDPAAETASAKVVPENGWKLFDITPLVKKKTGANENGVLIKFKDENKSGEKQDWSGYQFVSREGEGEWKTRRPQVLIVESADKETSAGTK